MICQQCGTENVDTRALCTKCGKDLKTSQVKGIVTCRNHGNRASTTICEQCLRPICEECTVIREGRVLCVDDARLDVAGDEEDRIEHLAIADPSVALHAGFPSRVLSGLIDLTIVVFAGFLLATIFWMALGMPPAGTITYENYPVVVTTYWVIYIVLVLAYAAILTAAEGQTFGKQALRIAVVESDGTTPSLGTAISRTLYSMLSFVCAGAGYFEILRNPARQAWHDRWANTYVISLDEGSERL